jgi:dTMP kinase
MLFVTKNMFGEKTKQGKLIVIDGTDGSGKATQTQMLAERLRNADFEVEIADFPQYGKKSAGLVEEYLNGKYGEAKDVGPYRASIFYAIDRYDASFKIREWIDNGKIVISNRYVTANMAHQGGKIAEESERQKYFDWLYNLEYNIFNIPRPDLNVILHVDAAIAQKLVDEKSARDYVGGKKRDIHEADINHLRDAEKIYLEIAQKFDDFCLIECVKNNEILSRDEINDLIWKKVLIEIETKHDNIQELSDLIAKNYPAQNREMVTVSYINKTGESRNPQALSNKSNPVNVTDRLALKMSKVTPDAKLPTRAHDDDAGFDLYANENCTLLANDIVALATGVRLAIPQGYAGLIWDKSGLALRGLKTMGGVIDAGFRGEVKVVAMNVSGDILHIAKGQKIAQIIIQKIEAPDLVESGELDETKRMDKGFGSTGKC